MAYEVRFGKMVKVTKWLNRKGQEVRRVNEAEIVRVLQAPGADIDLTAPNAASKILASKGVYMGRCNRSECLAPGALWYNHSTRKYYCRVCALWLNRDEFNYRDAHELYGHDLCTLGRHEEPAQGGENAGS